MVCVDRLILLELLVYEMSKYSSASKSIKKSGTLKGFYGKKLKVEGGYNKQVQEGNFFNPTSRISHFCQIYWDDRGTSGNKFHKKI